MGRPTILPVGRGCKEKATGAARQALLHLHDPDDRHVHRAGFVGEAGGAASGNPDALIFQFTHVEILGHSLPVICQDLANL
jgi:hypothetical protein